MRIQISEPVDVIRWAYRLLYVQLFIFVVVSMFYWDYPGTFAYLGAILCLFYVALIWKPSDDEARENTEKVLLNEQ